MLSKNSAGPAGGQKSGLARPQDEGGLISHRGRERSQRLFWLLAGISPFTHRGHGTRRTAERARIHLPEGVLSAGLSRLHHAPENARRPRVKLSIKNGRPFGRPYAKAPSVRLASRNRRRGAHWAPVLSCAFCMAFCGRAILFPAGGRWPPLREGPICAACFPEHRRGAQWAPVLPCTFRMVFLRAGNFAFGWGWRPMAAPTRRPNLCGLLPGAP